MKQTKAKQSRRLITAALMISAVIAACVIAYEVVQRRSETPLGDKKYTPDGEFYVQRSTVWSYRKWLWTPPGSGGDNWVGYIRLYDRNGRELKKHFHTDMGLIAPRISDDCVWLMGEDGFSWDLEQFREDR